MTTETLNYFTIEEFALYLKVHQETVRKWIKDGKLPAVKLGEGRRARYRISEVEAAAFLDRMMVSFPASPETPAVDQASLTRPRQAVKE